MISVTICKNRDNEYVGLKCKGHAGYDSSGKDIYCASVSILVINTLNSIEKLTDCRFETRENPAKGILEADFRGKLSKDATLLMDSLVLGLNGIVKDNGDKYLSVIIKEV